MDKNEFGMKPINNRSVVDLVMERITDAILSRQYKPGDKIPTEEQLSEALGVGRNPVREAVKVLVALGVLEIRRAEGTYVAGTYSERMFNPVLYGMIVEQSALEDLIEVRRVFDQGVAQLAIAKGTEKDMENIRSQCEEFIHQLQHFNGNLEILLQCDINFHRSIEAAAHNALLPNLSQVITKLTIPSRRETIRRGMEAGNVQYFIDCHRLLADVIINRQSERVLETINDHYDMWSEGKREEHSES